MMLSESSSLQKSVNLLTAATLTSPSVSLRNALKQSSKISLIWSTVNPFASSTNYCAMMQRMRQLLSSVSFLTIGSSILILDLGRCFVNATMQSTLCIRTLSCSSLFMFVKIFKSSFSKTLGIRLIISIKT